MYRSATPILSTPEKEMSGKKGEREERREGRRDGGKEKGREGRRKKIFRTKGHASLD